MKNIIKTHSRLIIGLIIGFLSCFCIAAVIAYADELPEDPGYSYEVLDVEADPDDLDVPDETDEEDPSTTPAARPRGNGVAERSEAGTRDRGVERRASSPTQQQPAPAVGQFPSPIQPLASGAIIADLMDLMNPPIENDGFTPESWERYEDAMAAAWNVVFNFMSYSDLEVLIVIIQLRAAIDGLEYIDGRQPPAEVSSLGEIISYMGVGVGVMLVSVVSGALRVAS
jgi:hypothetical protein